MKHEPETTCRGQAAVILPHTDKKSIIYIVENCNPLSLNFKLSSEENFFMKLKYILNFTIFVRQVIETLLALVGPYPSHKHRLKSVPWEKSYLTIFKPGTTSFLKWFVCGLKPKNHIHILVILLTFIMWISHLFWWVLIVPKYFMNTRNIIVYENELHDAGHHFFYKIFELMN